MLQQMFILIIYNWDTHEVKTLWSCYYTKMHLVYCAVVLRSIRPSTGYICELHATSHIKPNTGW